MKGKTPRVPRPVLDVLLAVYRASAGKHHRYFIRVNRLAVPLNRERARAAIQMGVLSGWLAGGGLPVHSVAMTDEGLGVLRVRRIRDLKKGAEAAPLRLATLTPTNGQQQSPCLP